jgi:disulfide bond formation protein DsbB
MLKSLTPRILCLIGFVVCIALLAGALYFQHGLYLEPCPLCIFQRVVFVAMGVVFFIGFLHNPRAVAFRVYSIIITLLALVGAGIATRHVWLQNLPPDQVPECGAGLDFMLEQNSLFRVVEMVFKGSGECAEVAWRFLGLSIPAWTLLIFIVFVLIGITLTLSGAKTKN